MKIKLKQYRCLFLLVSLFFIINGPKTEATTTSTEEKSQASLSVQTIIPENQRDKSKTYFDLRMTPGQKQTIVVQLTNSSEKEITVEVQANDATTNNNGIVEYSKVEKTRDPSLLVGFSDIAKTESEVKIPAGETKDAKIQLTMPDKEFDGEILGGLYIKEKNQQSSSSEADKGNGVINRFAYTIGVLLTENDHKITSNFVLKKVTASQSNYRNFVSVGIQNDKAITIKNASIETKIYKKGADKPLLARTSKNIRMAPNSNFDYMISLDNKPFTAGTYELEGQIRVGEQSWPLKKEFVISGKEAKKYNEEAVDLEDDYPWTVIYIIVAVILVLLLIIGVLFYWIRRKNKIKKRRKAQKRELSKKKNGQKRKKTYSENKNRNSKKNDQRKSSKVFPK